MPTETPFARLSRLCRERDALCMAIDEAATDLESAGFLEADMDERVDLAAEARGDDTPPW